MVLVRCASGADATTEGGTKPNQAPDHKCALSTASPYSMLSATCYRVETMATASRISASGADATTEGSTKPNEAPDHMLAS
jgi:hypothetical protein